MREECTVGGSQVWVGCSEDSVLYSSTVCRESRIYSRYSRRDLV